MESQTLGCDVIDNFPVNSPTLPVYPVSQELCTKQMSGWRLGGKIPSAHVASELTTHGAARIRSAACAYAQKPPSTAQRAGYRRQGVHARGMARSLVLRFPS